MADRLAELLRQRALLQEHLEWLDAEIAAASGREPAKGQPVQAPRVTPVPTNVVTQILAAATPPRPAPVNPQSAFGSASGMATETVGGAGDEILDQYRSSPDSLKTDVRKGCFLYFAVAFLILGLGVAALWYAFRSKRDANDLRPPPQMERRL